MATATRFEELVAWQLADAAKEEVFRLTNRPDVASDKGFCEQIHSSARLAPANLAEGFSRYHPKPFKNYATIARASLDETKNHTSMVSTVATSHKRNATTCYPCSNAPSSRRHG